MIFTIVTIFVIVIIWLYPVFQSQPGIAVTTAINMCARGEVSLLLWGNWTLPPVQEGPPLMRGDPSFAGGELRAARAELRKGQQNFLFFNHFHFFDYVHAVGPHSWSCSVNMYNVHCTCLVKVGCQIDSVSLFKIVMNN